VLNQLEDDQRSRVFLTIEGTDAGTRMPRSMLETAVRNLVDNALRYSPEDTTIEIHALFDHAAQHCVLGVADQGQGLSPEQVTQIGRRFRRCHQARQRKDGSLLFIFIVLAIAERFGSAPTL